jgi:hypothetical protein
LAISAEEKEKEGEKYQYQRILENLHLHTGREEGKVSARRQIEKLFQYEKGWPNTTFDKIRFAKHFSIKLHNIAQHFFPVFCLHIIALPGGFS